MAKPERKDDLRLARKRMVDQLAHGEYAIHDRQVLEVMRTVPRHRFVSGQHLIKQAYGDSALPIGHRQTISQPWVVARMSELLAVGPEHSVLEIGTGSGYQTAILAHLARRVFSLERIAALAREAVGRMRELHLSNVKIQAFDGTVGWGGEAPFDRILVTAATPSPVPTPWLDQMAPDGIMVVPEGGLEHQRLVRYARSEGGLERCVFERVVFVPLIGRLGWQEGAKGG